MCHGNEMKRKKVEEKKLEEGLFLIQSICDYKIKWWKSGSQLTQTQLNFP